MDILDDVVVVLRVVLDYLGIDMEDVQDLLEEINARRRERFYCTRQAISYYWTRVVDRRQCILNRMNRIQTDVRHRSLIRIAGSYLPLKPLKRVRIQNHLLQTRQPKFMYDSDSDDSVITTTSVGSTSDDDMVWVEEDIGDNCVRVRAEKRRHFDASDVFDELDDDLFIARNTSSRSPMMSSTMISSVSSMFQNPAEQTQKLTAMEDELTILRQQIAMLVEAQEQINKSQLPPQSFKEDELLVVTSCPPLMAPPLPPLPPPPPPPTTTKQLTPTVSPIETDKQKTVLHTVNKNSADTPNSLPTLTDVLKGLGNVRLKSIRRSPGGTPIKPKSQKRESVSDPASVIAQALKKKFANQFIHSPDIDKENDSHGFSSPDTNSPHYFGERNKRILRKRSIFTEDKNRLSEPLRL